MKLSVVSTLYQSADHIREFYQQTSRAAREFAGDDFEIVLVNDGSPDKSIDIAIQLCDEDYHVKVVDLSRNFGHHKALFTGLQQSVGDHVFLVDSDLEEDPRWLLTFYQELTTSGSDVVFGVQIRRKGHWFERWSGEVYWTIFKLAAGFSIPNNSVTARLMTRRYVDALLMHHEREFTIGGLYVITGFKQLPCLITKLSISRSTYRFSHKMAIFVNSITSFSNKPLIGVFYVGILIFFMASVYVGYLVVYRLYFSKTISGWTSVMASIWLIGGLIISFIGVIGIYLSKIFLETKQRPISIIRQVYSKQRKEA